MSVLNRVSVCPGLEIEHAEGYRETTEDDDRRDQTAPNPTKDDSSD
jgi:hypothetical protein